MTTLSLTCQHCGAPFSYTWRSGTPAAYCGQDCRHAARLLRRRAPRSKINHRMVVSHPCQTCPTVISYEVTDYGARAYPIYCAPCRVLARKHKAKVGRKSAFELYCRNGHRRTAKNTHVRASGHRECLMCQSIVDKRRRSQASAQHQGDHYGTG